MKEENNINKAVKVEHLKHKLRCDLLKMNFNTPAISNKERKEEDNNE